MTAAIAQHLWQATPPTRAQRAKCATWLVRFASCNQPDAICSQHKSDARLIEARCAKPLATRQDAETHWGATSGPHSWSSVVSGTKPAAPVIVKVAVVQDIVMTVVGVQSQPIIDATQIDASPAEQLQAERPRRTWLR